MRVGGDSGPAAAAGSANCSGVFGKATYQHLLKANHTHLCPRSDSTGQMHRDAHGGRVLRVKTGKKPLR